jgi:hypothetical protein
MCSPSVALRSSEQQSFYDKRVASGSICGVQHLSSVFPDSLRAAITILTQVSHGSTLVPFNYFFIVSSLSFIIIFTSAFSLRAISTHCSCVHIAIGWLREFLVGQHFVLKSNQTGFHTHFWLPILENFEASLNCAVTLVDRWNVDLGGEPNNRWSNRVILSTLKSQEVDAIVEVCAGRSNNRTIPVSKGLVITLVETIRNAAVAQVALLSLLELFIKLEGAWH